MSIDDIVVSSSYNVIRVYGHLSPVGQAAHAFSFHSKYSNVEV